MGRPLVTCLLPVIIGPPVCGAHMFSFYRDAVELNVNLTASSHQVRPLDEFQVPMTARLIAGILLADLPAR